MADGGAQDVLGLKARAAQKAVEARGMSTAKALRRSLARTADTLWELALVCNGVALEVLDQDGVIDALRRDTLLVLLDGPGGLVGLAQVDRTVLTGLTEIQTIQTVTALPPDMRPLTPTDAAMTAPFLDGALARFAANLEGNPLQPQLTGFRFGAMVEDARGAALVLDAAAYRTFHVELDLAGGTRAGVLSLFLPERPEDATQDDEDPDTPGPHAVSLRELPARLHAILARLTLPLAQVNALQAGDLLPLQATAIETVDLVPVAGPAVARGRLGQLNGARAVRITWPEGEAGAGSDREPGAAPFDMGGAGPLDDGLPALDAADTADFGETAEAFGTAEGDEAAEPAPFGLDALQSPMDDLPDLPPLDPGNGDETGDMAAWDADGGFGAAPMDLDFDPDK